MFQAVFQDWKISLPTFLIGIITDLSVRRAFGMG